jgi:hypothetical protein
MKKKTNRDIVISFFKTFPEGIDDDLLAEKSGLKSRHQTNAICRELESEGLLSRFKINGKIHNFWITKVEEPASPETQNQGTLFADLSENPKADAWFTKSNVQARVIKYLCAKNFYIQFDSENDSHHQEIDIISEKNQKFLCISVKGYPDGESIISSISQAEDWFKQAIFDIISYRQQDKKFLLAVALPDFPLYKSMPNRILWLKDAAKFNYLWVGKDGCVVME